MKILTDGAKYDAACTSSGVARIASEGGMGSTSMGGICHAFSGDGRCISLLKILLSNACCYDCAYCVNRVSNDVPRATFTAEEIASLTMNMYRRYYIEGLFLSSGVLGTPDNTTQQMIKALELLRVKYKFCGYIHAKAIPGTSPDLLERLERLADRVSSNIELPSSASLRLLAPEKERRDVLAPMSYICMRHEDGGVRQGFVRAGQSTQMIIGATPESDLKIIRLTEGLYGRYKLKRVFYSAYIPVADNSLLPALDSKPPLLREHRLYQADWLMRFYHFKADEILDESHPYFNEFLDPKCNWAVNHPEFFPVDVNRASYETLLRVPGVGVKSARRIMVARKQRRLDIFQLAKLGVVVKRAKYFVEGGMGGKLNAADHPERVVRELIRGENARQLSLFDDKDAGSAPLLGGKEDIRAIARTGK